MPSVEVLDLSGSQYNVDYINGHFLSSLTTIKEIILPYNIKKLRNGDGQYGGTLYGAFYGCTSLTSITLPEGLTTIEWGSFYECSSLTSITIPNSITSIEREVFYGCSSLVSISIPEGVTNIGLEAFQDCSSLASINIPESVTSIGNYAFSHCSSLKLIKWNTDCPIATDYFDDHFDDLSGRLVLYTTKDVISSDGSEVTTAKKAIYTKEHFSWSWGLEGNRWYTISLPFKPSQISHETKGTIAPFDSDVEGAKNFWLRELTANGYQNVTEMEAGHAYIIAMPTDYSYDAEYRLGGIVTFSAEDVTIDWKTTPAVGPTYTMYPTYETVKKAKDVYALNSEYWVDGYEYGHVFVHSAMDVSAFEAYVKLNNGSNTRSVISLSGSTRSGDANTRSTSGHRKPMKEDM
jgi:hypothetical protein